MPLYFHQGGDAITQLSWEWLIRLLTMSLVFAILAWLCFQQRNIHVGDEGS